MLVLKSLKAFRASKLLKHRNFLRTLNTSLTVLMNLKAFKVSRTLNASKALEAPKILKCIANLDEVL